MHSPPLSAKIRRPTPRPDLVDRPRLWQRLDACWDYPLTLVTAPAGYGKSTLLSQWLAQEDWAAQEDRTARPAAWLALDEDDDEWSRFLAGFVAALQTIQPDLGAATAEMLATGQPAGAALMSGLIAEISAVETPFALVLDDYHLLQNETSHRELARLVTYAPPALHLILLSRDQPPLPLARWRARGRLLELTRDDLRFQPTEARDLLQTETGLDVPDAAGARVNDQTEGWATGLHLVSLALSRAADPAAWLAAFDGRHHFIWEYLAAEVLERLPAADRDFLGDISVLDSFDAGLAAALTGRADSADLLRRLADANLFLIPLDDTRQTFRFHHLMRDYLRAALERRDPERPARLHQRAAAWYTAAGDIFAASKQLRLAGDLAALADLLTAHADTIWRDAAMGPVRRLGRELPDAILADRPELALTLVSTTLDSGELKAAEHYWRLAAAAYGLSWDGILGQLATPPAGLDPVKFDELATLRCTIAYFQRDLAAGSLFLPFLRDRLAAPGKRRRSLVALNLGSILALQGERDEATTYLQIASQYAGQEGNRYLAFLTLGQLGSMQIAWGQLPAALATLPGALQMLPGSQPMTGWIYANLAEVHYEWNELEKCAASLEQALHYSRDRTNQGIFFFCQLLSARLAAAQGDAAAAEAALAAARVTAARLPGTAPAQAEALAAELRLHGGAAAAAAWVATQPAAAPDFETGLSLIRVRLALGQTAPAGAALNPLLAQAAATGQTNQVIQLTLCQALLAAADGAEAEALIALEAVLPAVVAGRYRRSFYDLDVAMRRFLVGARLKLAPEWQVYVADLLARWPEVAAAPPPPAGAQTGPLTRRELQVLELISDGLTNQEIAARLHIAAGTVKKHIDNIYAKLDVHGRVQALARARELALI